VVLGKGGVEKVIELDLSSESQERFAKSVSVVKGALALLKS